MNHTPFSDAMRKADELGYPNRHEEYMEQNKSKWVDGIPQCCAIAGANIVLGNVDITAEPDLEGCLPWAEVRKCWVLPKGLEKVVQGCPSGEECKYTHNCSIEFWIIHLYDDHKWTRSQVADWLTPIEAAS